MRGRIALAVDIALLSGCAALRPSDSVTTLRLAPTFAPVPSRRNATLTLAHVEASGMAGERRYVYVLASDPLVLHQAATLFWEVPPPVTIERALDEATRARLSRTPGSPNLGQLYVRLTRFDEVSHPDRAEAVVEVDAALTDAPHGRASSGRYCRATLMIPGNDGRARAFQLSVVAVAEAIAGDAASGSLGASPC